MSIYTQMIVLTAGPFVAGCVVLLIGIALI
jgi:hypothetical protein